jgi:hypothetical protein
MNSYWGVLLIGSLLLDCTDPGRILNYFVLGRSHIPLSLRGRNVIVAFSGAYSRFPQFPQDSSSFGEEEHSAGSVLVFQKPANTAVLETQISKLH